MARSTTKAARGHIAAILKQGKEEKQKTDHRNEGGNRLDADANAIGQHGDEPGGRSDQLKQMGGAIDNNRAGENVEEINEGASEIDRQQEHQIHDEQEDGDAEQATEHHLIDPLGPCLGQATHMADHVLGKAIGKAIATIGDQQVRVLAAFIRQPCQKRVERPARRGIEEGQCPTIAAQ